MSIALYVAAGLCVLGALLVVGSVGKPRKPISPGTAALNVLVQGCWAGLMVLAARGLH